MDGKSQRQLFSSAMKIVQEGKKKNKSKKKEVLDPVGKEDEDVDNDGDVDKTDSYLKNRREVVKAKIGKLKKTKKTLNERKIEIIESLLDERHDPAALLARAFDRAKQKRAAGQEAAQKQYPGLYDEEKSVGPVVTPESPAQEADFAAHLAAEISSKRHSYDPTERREQRRAETPAYVTTRMPGDSDRHPADAESTAQEMDHARMHSAIQDAGGIHAGDHAEHGITSFDLGAESGEAHKGYMHTSDKEIHKGKIFVPHEVSLGNSSTHAFFQQGKESIGRRLYRHEEGDLNNLYGVKERGIGESTNKTFTQKELTEATMSRIKMIGKAKKSYDSHPGVDRLR